MKTIIANLKLYLPNRYFWPAYLYSALVIFFVAQIAAEQKENIQLMVGVFMNLPFFAGFLASLLQIEVFSKPFSLCLPEHRQKVKSVLLIIGVIVSLVLAYIEAVLIFGNQWIIMVIPLLPANFIFFLLGAELTFLTRSVLFWVWVIMFMPSFYHPPYEILGGLITQFHLVFIFVGLLCSIKIWRKLNFSDKHRKFCTVPQAPIFGFWNKQKLEKYSQFKMESQKGKFKGEIKPSVERFFLDRMNKYKYFGMGKYIWGNLYTVYGPQFSNFNPMSVLFILVMLLVFCYGHQSSAIVLFMMVLMITIFIQMPIHSTMLISDGRKERFYGVLGLSISYTFYILIFCTIVIVLTNIAGYFMPDFVLFDKTLTYRPIGFSFCLLPAVAVPFVFTFRLVFHKRTFLMFVTVIVLYSIMMALLLSLSSFAEVRLYEAPSIIVNPFTVTFFVVFLWAVFLSVLRRACFKWSLI